MKKQLLTGALALSVLMGSTGMAFAASIPATDLIKADATSAKVDAADAEQFKMSDKKAYTADSYAKEIETTKAELKTLVESKQLTRDNADKIVNHMEQELQKIKDGTLTLNYFEMLDKDGKVIGKVSLASGDKDVPSISNLLEPNSDTVQDKNSLQSVSYAVKMTDGEIDITSTNSDKAGK